MESRVMANPTLKRKLNFDVDVDSIEKRLKYKINFNFVDSLKFYEALPRTDAFFDIMDYDQFNIIWKNLPMTKCEDLLFKIDFAALMRFTDLHIDKCRHFRAVVFEYNDSLNFNENYIYAYFQYFDK